MEKTQVTHYAPKFKEKSFNCPHCNTFAKQEWAQLTTGKYQIEHLTHFGSTFNNEWFLSSCSLCFKHMIWNKTKIIYPKTNLVPEPNNDLSEEIKKDYFEASNILGDSPRAAAALLRLALQKLCKDLGQDGKNINTDIGKLVELGLNPMIQKAMDALRITGNNAVHPGEINLNEEPEKVIKLFQILNFIASKMITEPKELNEFYDELPENAKQGVEVRDK